MDIGSLSVAELQQLKTRIDEEIVRRKHAEKDTFVKELAKLAAARGYVLDELLGEGAKKSKGKSRKPASIKYQHPENSGLTWTGRGRQPGWVKEWAASGKAMEQLAVSANI